MCGYVRRPPGSRLAVGLDTPHRALDWITSRRPVDDSGKVRDDVAPEVESYAHRARSCYPNCDSGDPGGSFELAVVVPHAAQFGCGLIRHTGMVFNEKAIVATTAGQDAGEFRSQTGVDAGVPDSALTGGCVVRIIIEREVVPLFRWPGEAVGLPIFPAGVFGQEVAVLAAIGRDAQCDFPPPCSGYPASVASMEMATTMRKIRVIIAAKAWANMDVPLLQVSFVALRRCAVPRDRAASP